MISARVRETIEAIEPLFSADVADELGRRWMEIPAPPGALGRFETLATHFAIIRGTATPRIGRMGMYVICSDHGVAEDQVSSTPEVTTAELAMGFARGELPGSVLCRRFGIEAQVVDAGMTGPRFMSVIDARVAPGSANLSKGQAMTVEQTNHALESGIVLAHDAAERFDAVGLAQIGVGGSTPASAVFAAMSGRDPQGTTTRPPGLPEAAFHRKVALIRTALNRHNSEFFIPFGVLRAVGGLDLAMMTGFLLGAAALRFPVVLDDFAAGVAAMMARGLCADSLDVAIFAHDSGDPAHRNLFTSLDVTPQIALGLNSAPGCGAAAVLQLLGAAISLLEASGGSRN